MGRSLLALSVALAVAGAMAACAAPDDGEDESDLGLGEAAVSSLDPNGSPQVAITEPEALRRLEASGYGFGHHFDRPDDARADALLASPAYASIVEGIESNLDALLREDRSLGVGMRYAHRLFDRAWLRSARSRFALVAVTNRLDRAATSGACGETRFVYRLEYDDPREGASSRMPMTVAIVLPQAPRAGEDDCSLGAKRWMNLGGTGAPLAIAAARGPLAGLPRMMSVETNLQAVRWPSSVRKDMGGEAEYMLNVWRPAAGGGLEMAPLDNTPDVAAIAADPAKKRALALWVTSQAPAIDRGSAKLPEELSARTAYSYGPRGLSRLANRPFSQLLAGVDLSSVAFDTTTHVKSALGLVRKLDESSCQGCHQARAMAGFHVLGNEDDRGTNHKLNRLAVGTSPHFNEELAWRMRLVRATAGGVDPRALPEARPFAEHATNDGLVGASCGLGADPSFADWRCGEGLACVDMIGDAVVGTCTTAGGPRPGDVCEKDRLISSADPHADRVQNLDSGDAACGRVTPGAYCSGASGGFPGGSCSAACTKMGLLKDRVICGAAPPAGFNECMGRGRETFEACMSPPKLALRAACSVVFPCRDDYVCAYVPGAPEGTGACMPPYFIFQARVDGHE
ncbi:MAG: hypothetical protein KF764_11850 [Labilithrix sp.]|nr:hypothetical protein [Labilithrix sp.]